MNKPSAKTTITIVRNAITIGVGLSTFGITSAIIKNNTDEPDTFASKAGRTAGSLVIGTMVAEKTSAWTDRFLRTVIDGVEETVKSEPQDDLTEAPTK